MKKITGFSLIAFGIFLHGYFYWFAKDISTRVSPFVQDLSEPFFHPYNLLMVPLVRSMSESGFHPSELASVLNVIIMSAFVISVFSVVGGLLLLLVPRFKRKMLKTAEA